MFNEVDDASGWKYQDGKGGEYRDEKHYDRDMEVKGISFSIIPTLCKLGKIVMDAYFVVV